MSPIKNAPPNASGDQLKNAINRTFSPFATIVIDRGNTIVDPSPPSAKCPRNGAVVWLVYNNDSAPHTVGVDPGSFKVKNSGTKSNPLVGKQPLSASVRSGEFSHLVAVIRADAPFETYKYTITSDGKPLDPDLDVVDP